MLVAAVLAPERAEHAEFDGGEVSFETVAGEAVLVRAEGELLQGVVVDGDGGGAGGVVATHAGHQPHRSMMERQTRRPSSLPRRASLARSGWGIMPRTVPAALMTPAMAARDPLGLACGVMAPAGSQ